MWLHRLVLHFSIFHVFIDAYLFNIRYNPFRLYSSHKIYDVSSSALIQVWDHVLSTDQCTQLDSWTRQSNIRSHLVFQRSQPNNYLEKVLASILSTLDSSSDSFVEYWARQEWRNMEAHADVDENLAKEQESHLTNVNYRYPEHGHVLYLQVGQQVRGPTCLFPHRSAGGDLIQGDKVIDLITVPAVAGRLLRFEGSMLHAVPRPTDLWLLPFVQGASLNEPGEEWGRSVILFNTWDSPPKDVSRGAKESMEDSRPQFNSNHDWRPSFEYYRQMIHEMVVAPNSTSVAKIWLLGTAARRKYSWRTINVIIPDEEKIREALYEPTEVNVVQLLQSQ